MRTVRNLGSLGRLVRLVYEELINNENLLKLLYYEDRDPLAGAPLTKNQINEEIFEKLVKITPIVGQRLDSKNTLVITVSGATKNRTNKEFINLILNIEIFVPLTQWVIKNEGLRPFVIMSELEKSLNGKNFEEISKFESAGFESNFLTEEMSSYIMSFMVTLYD